MLVSIVRDMGPFLVVMSIIMLGVTVSMIVITGSAENLTNHMNSDFFDVIFKVPNFLSLSRSPFSLHPFPRSLLSSSFDSPFLLLFSCFICVILAF
jgi:hypothetical protein